MDNIESGRQNNHVNLVNPVQKDTSKKQPYKIVINEVTDVNGDGRIRRFSDKMARTAYERQGGKTVAENCQMLCADCNRRKSDV